MKKNLLPALVCEFIGVFALCFIGISAISHLGAVPGGLLGIALAHGLTIAVMVSAAGAISGGHLNPAVTAGLFAAGKIDALSSAAYIVAQILGGVVAALAAGAILPAGAVSGGTPALASGITPGVAILAEFIATFFLIHAVYGTAVDGRAPKVAGLFIGLTVTIGILAIGPVTGGALNPARHLGPALIGGNAAQIAQIWIYWVGPVLGGVVAGLLWRHVLEEK